MAYPNSAYEHRVITGITVDQLARLEKFMASDKNLLAVRPAKVHMPNTMQWRHNELNAVAVLDMTVVVKDYPCMRVVTFAKSPKRDAKSELYTVDLFIPVMIACIRGSGEGGSDCEVGMYHFGRQYADGVTAALELNSSDGQGSFFKTVPDDIL
jgi:hypothetical protein